MMRLKVLGCSGGIGGKNHTTSFLLEDSVLIDAGTGVGLLDFDALIKIDHVFLSHAHFDHIACLPSLLDSVNGRRKGRPITLHACEATLQSLREHVFNWQIWPDFSFIPDESNALLRFAPLEVGETHCVADCRITALPAQHTIPAMGFCLDSGNASLVYSGDSVGGEDFWQAVNAIGNLSTLIIETAFPNREISLARAAQHLCPADLQRELQSLDRPVEVLITHLKPADNELIIEELAQLDCPVRCLSPGDRIEF